MMDETRNSRAGPTDLSSCRTPVKGPGEFGRERSYTTLEGQEAFGRNRMAARSGLIFGNLNERDAGNSLCADR